MPFAAALGLTMTVKVEQRMMVRELDRPTPFTIKGVRWQGANKNDFKTGRLHTPVFARCLPKQNTYTSRSKVVLERQRVRPSQNQPVTVKLNRYGNPLEARAASNVCRPKRTPFRELSMVLLVFGKDPSVVSAVVVAVARIDQSGLKLLVAYESSTQYQLRFDFYGIGDRSVRTNISKEMNKAVARVLQSAT